MASADYTNPEILWEILHIQPCLFSAHILWELFSHLAKQVIDFHYRH